MGFVALPLAEQVGEERLKAAQPSKRNPNMIKVYKGPGKALDSDNLRLNPASGRGKE